MNILLTWWRSKRCICSGASVTFIVHLLSLDFNKSLYYQQRCPNFLWVMPPGSSDRGFAFRGFACEWSLCTKQLWYLEKLAQTRQVFGHSLLKFLQSRAAIVNLISISSQIFFVPYDRFICRLIIGFFSW